MNFINKATKLLLSFFWKRTEVNHWLELLSTATYLPWIIPKLQILTTSCLTRKTPLSSVPDRPKGLPSGSAQVPPWMVHSCRESPQKSSSKTGSLPRDTNTTLDGKMPGCFVPCSTDSYFPTTGRHKQTAAKGSRPCQEAKTHWFLWLSQADPFSTDPGSGPEPN